MTTISSAGTKAFSGSRAGKLIATGGALGVILSLAAHSSPGIHKISAPAGALIAFVFGLIYGAISPGTAGGAAAGGALTGGGSALIGILVAVLLHDQPGMILGAGTMGGVVAGTLGALLGRLLGSRRRARTNVRPDR